MKLLYTIVLMGFIAVSNTGCLGTIYATAVDERDVSTVVNDTGIELDIIKKLTEIKSSDVLDVSVTSYEGNVFLVGEYENLTQKNRYLNAARNVKGVKSIGSYLIKENKNHPCGTSKNLEITAKVKAALIADGSIWSTNVRISTMQCEVVLWGTVGSQEEIFKSIKHAKAVEDVKSVKSFLKAKR